MTMVNILRCMICIIVVGSAHIALVRSQDQTGFISIDCGLSDASDYIDSTTKIRYSSDANFTTTGANEDIPPVYQAPWPQKQLATVRAFPQGTRNCYTLTPPNGTGTNYLIRATFMYGNYDSINKPPTFDLLIGVDVWDTIKLDNSTQVVVREIIHTPFSENLDVCLVNTGKGIPLISTLELRLLNNTIYNRDSGSLALVGRFYAHPTSTPEIRYEDDICDRIWTPFQFPDQPLISTLLTVNTSLDSYRIPPAAMKAAIAPTAGSKSMNLVWRPQSSATQYYFFMYFAELQRLGTNETREFNITFDGAYIYGPFEPSYLVSDAVFNTRPHSGSNLIFTFTSTERSTLPPIINAFELYKVQELVEPATDQVDALTMLKIRSKYDMINNWQGDPCNPRAYSWSGVNCSYDSNITTIISLNLSSSGLKGEIANSISNLTSLQVLDLSNNNLTGEIPDFLANLTSLKTLYLGGNNFTGSIPPALAEKSREGLLDLSWENSGDHCTGGSCAKKKPTKLIIIIVASIVAVVIIAATIICTFCLMKRKKQSAGGSMQDERAAHVIKKGGLYRFSHSEVTEITKGFEKQLGQGAYGMVYCGCLKDGTQVAVKMLQQSIQGSQQFATEVELLMAIRHKNLVSLIGYCEEENKLALIYEYMAKRDLKGLLSDSDELISWKQRLQIAVDSAQGVEYLHNGCRPPIVHRDIKTPNILLNDNMQAKVADFGLSKMFPDEKNAYVTTRVIGTLGYLDPEYHITEQLNEKSDVYSFGIVLLELVTGKPAVIRIDADRRTSLIHWVSPILDRGDIRNIVDERLQDVRSQNSIWKLVDIAMVCVKPTSHERPTMSQVVIELKECLAMEMEMDHTQGNRRDSVSPPNDSIGMMNTAISFTSTSPSAR